MAATAAILLVLKIPHHDDAYNSALFLVSRSTCKQVRRLFLRELNRFVILSEYTSHINNARHALVCRSYCLLPLEHVCY